MKRIAMLSVILGVIAGPAAAQIVDEDVPDDLGDTTSDTRADPIGESGTSTEMAAETPASPADASVVAANGLGPAGKVLGFGFQRTPVGLTGAHIEYHMGALALDGMLGFTNVSPDGGGSVTAFGLAMGAFYKLFWHDDGGLALGGRFVIATLDGPGGGATQEFALEVPARVEIFLGSMLALHLEAGLTVNIAGDEGGALAGSRPGELGIGLGNGSAGIFGGAGFTAYIY